MTGVSDVWFHLVVAALATWRVTHLLANEDGPADVIFRIRRRLKGSFLGKLADCFQCLSVWVAIPMAFFVGRDALEGVVCWLALSGAAGLLERICREDSPPVVIQNLETSAEILEDGMLWTKSRDAGK